MVGTVHADFRTLGATAQRWWSGGEENVATTMC
jgi:hypothetical protein